MTPSSGWPRRPILLPAGAAIAGAIFAAGLLRKGVVMGPDSWAYWEGSVSLIESGRYEYFGGEPITSFPPLFSWVLALFQTALGISTRTLAIAVVMVVAAASAGWMSLYVVLTSERPRQRLMDAMPLLYVPATLAVYAQVLLSETVWHALLPLVLLPALAPARPGAWRGWEYLRPVAICVTLALLLLCRNATVALLPGLLLMLVLTGSGRPVMRGLTGAVAIAGALLPWYWIRRSLTQLANHPIGTSHSGVLENATEVLGGLTYAFGPSRAYVGTVLCGAACALLVWDLASEDSGARRPRLALLAFALLGLVGLVGIFSATHVGEPLAGRFVVFAVLSMALVVFAGGPLRPVGVRRHAVAAVGVVLTLVALYRVGIKYTLAGREQEATPLNVWISSSYSSGPPQPSGGQVLVAPPAYPWMQRGGRR